MTSRRNRISKFFLTILKTFVGQTKIGEGWLGAKTTIIGASKCFLGGGIRGSTFFGREVSKKIKTLEGWAGKILWGRGKRFGGDRKIHHMGRGSKFWSLWWWWNKKKDPTCRKNYETYNRSARLLFSNKYLSSNIKQG